jgi:hypothetical protein
MKALLDRLPDDEFEIVHFGDDCILNTPVDEWPKVDALIAFYSDGYPLEKAQEYVKKNQPLMINNFSRESDMLDRRKVYNILEENGIPVPRHVVMDREDPNTEFIEHDDWVSVNGIASFLLSFLLSSSFLPSSLPSFHLLPSFRIHLLMSFCIHPSFHPLSFRPSILPSIVPSFPLSSFQGSRSVSPSSRSRWTRTTTIYTSTTP